MAPQLKARYVDTGEVKLVWHDFAWIGEESRQAAQGARCAAREGKFWEYHDVLYGNQRGENQGQFSMANLVGFAGTVGLDPTSFSGCLGAGADLPRIREELTEARERGVRATPYFLINDRPTTARTLDAFAGEIDSERARRGTR